MKSKPFQDSESEQEQEQAESKEESESEQESEQDEAKIYEVSKAKMLALKVQAAQEEEKLQNLIHAAIQLQEGILKMSSTFNKPK